MKKNTKDFAQTIEPFVVEVPKPIIWEGTMLDKAKTDLFFMDSVVIKRTGIEFIVTWYGGTIFEINIKEIFSIPEDTRDIFLKEMELNLREQYGTT
jgi:hypothetical protein